MAVEGSLDLFQLPEILQIISQEHKTGILTVQGHDDIVAISFLNGQVVSADALNKTLEDGLGEVLLDRNLVTREDYEAAQAEKRRSNSRLMDALIETGALERRELLDALRLLTHDLLSELLAWREGEFKFYGGDEVSYEEGFRPIAVEDLLLANLPQATEKVSQPPPEASPVPKPSEPKSPQSAAKSPRRKSVPEPAAAPRPSPSEVFESDLPLTRQSPVSEGGSELDLAPISLRPKEPPIEALRRPTPVRPEPSHAPPAEGVEPRAAGTSDRGLRAALGWGLGILVTGLLVAMLLAFPASFLLPSGANAEEREALLESRRNAHYSKIEAALRTYALLEAARLPEQLEELVQIGVLSNEEIVGALGQPLLYEADGQVYRLRLLLTEKEAAFTGSLRGDFLRDTEMLREPSTRAVPPLVLLD